MGLVAVGNTDDDSRGLRADLVVIELASWLVACTDADATLMVSLCSLKAGCVDIGSKSEALSVST